MVLLEKEEQKNEKYSRELYRKKPKKKVLINSRLKAIQIIGQREDFCSQKVPGSLCTTKETVDIIILVICRTGDRKNQR